MTKKQWLNERVFVDEYGRPYNLSDVPMTYMTREEAFIKQGGNKKDINNLWKETKNERKETRKK
jgi:hypothetical protein|tara:strand:+ start:1087 stop:1278 length:192 start_codon:yes stop_codon:yes gene_type:complete